MKPRFDENSSGRARISLDLDDSIDFRSPWFPLIGRKVRDGWASLQGIDGHALPSCDGRACSLIGDVVRNDQGIKW
ncbi:MAG: hypothetical protein CMJ23_08320 [Phycisphaerae bacterium]|nr:hypothetical protein [Phycisphaerae bacterium]